MPFRKQMKKLIILLVLLLPAIANAQIWQETFNGLANGTTSDAGATAWTTVQPSGSSRKFNKQTPATNYELFEVDNTGTEGVWTSQNINISMYTEVALKLPCTLTLRIVQTISVATTVWMAAPKQSSASCWDRTVSTSLRQPARSFRAAR